MPRFHRDGTKTDGRPTAVEFDRLVNDGTDLSTLYGHFYTSRQDASSSSHGMRIMPFIRREKTETSLKINIHKSIGEDGNNCFRGFAILSCAEQVV